MVGANTITSTSASANILPASLPVSSESTTPGYTTDPNRSRRSLIPSAKAVRSWRNSGGMAASNSPKYTDSRPIRNRRSFVEDMGFPSGPRRL